MQHEQIPAPPTFTMWEALAVHGRAQELALWADAHASRVARIYCSEDDRVVVIGPAPLGLPAAPADLIVRAPQGWDFAEVNRT